MLPRLLLGESVPQAAVKVKRAGLSLTKTGGRPAYIKPGVKTPISSFLLSKQMCQLLSPLVGLQMPLWNLLNPNYHFQ